MKTPDSEPSSFLPKVEEVDLLLTLSQEMDDPRHLERWKNFAKSQPELAYEILEQAAQRPMSGDGNEVVDNNLHTRIVDAVSLAIQALENAGRRQYHLFSDGDDEAPPPAAEPPDAPPFVPLSPAPPETPLDPAI